MQIFLQHGCYSSYSHVLPVVQLQLHFVESVSSSNLFIMTERQSWYSMAVNQHICCLYSDQPDPVCSACLVARNPKFHLSVSAFAQHSAAKQWLDAAMVTAPCCIACYCRTRLWFWDSVVLFQTFGIAAAQVFATSLDPYFQLIIMLIVLMLGVTILSHCQPFNERLPQNTQV